MYDENIATIAVIKAAVISIARFLLIALFVWSIGKCDDDGTGQVAHLGKTQSLPSAVGRDMWLSIGRCLPRVTVHQAGRLVEENGLDVLELLFDLAVARLDVDLSLR